MRNPFHILIEELFEQMMDLIVSALDAMRSFLQPVRRSLLGALAIASTINVLWHRELNPFSLNALLVCWFLLGAKCITYSGKYRGDHAEGTHERKSDKRDDDNDQRNRHLYTSE